LNLGAEKHPNSGEVASDRKGKNGKELQLPPLLNQILDKYTPKLAK
jgi:hypothetical protein